MSVREEYAPKLPEYDPLNPTKLSKPRVNPLGNPLIYRTTTQAAISCTVSGSSASIVCYRLKNRLMDEFEIE